MQSSEKNRESALTVRLPEASSVVKESSGLVVQLVALPRNGGSVVENVSIVLTNCPMLEKEDLTGDGYKLCTYQSSRVRYWFSLTLSLAIKSGRAREEAAKAAASRMNFILKWL